MTTTATAPPITAPADTPDPASPATPSAPAAEPIHEKFSPYSGQDAKGRYLKGNPGGPGNPYARRTAALRHAILDVVTPDEIRALAGRLLELAREGDLAAAKLVLSYAVGKPADAVNPDTLDVQEWQLFRQETGNGQHLGEVVEGMPVALLCEIARSTVPILHYCMRDYTIKALRGEPTGPAGNPAEQGVPARPQVPNPEEVLPKPPRKRSRTRKNTTTTPDAAAVTPSVAAAGGSTEAPAVAEVAQEKPVLAEQPPASEGVSTTVAGERGGVSPVAEVVRLQQQAPPLQSPPVAEVVRLQEQAPPLKSHDFSYGLTSSQPPVDGSPVLEAGEHGPDSASTTPAAPASPPVPQAPAEDAGTNNDTQEPPRPGVEPTGAAQAERVGRLPWLLRRLGLAGGAPPLPNGSNGRAHRTDSDNGAQNSPPT
jgi:hypothetical protein